MDELENQKDQKVVIVKIGDKTYTLNNPYKDGADELTDELTDEEEAKLVKNNYSEVSINKFLKKILKFIDPFISNKQFWKILSEFGKSIKLGLVVPSDVGATDILGRYAPDKQPKTQSRISSSFLAEALISNNLHSSGLSENHENLSENLKSIEKRTRLRRAQPLYPSQVLGDSHKYRVHQLVRKAPPHLEDFGISTEGKTLEERAIEYYDLGVLYH